jgi:hypothetical protein
VKAYHQGPRAVAAVRRRHVHGVLLQGAVEGRAVRAAEGAGAGGVGVAARVEVVEGGGEEGRERALVHEVAVAAGHELREALPDARDAPHAARGYAGHRGVGPGAGARRVEGRVEPNERAPTAAQGRGDLRGDGDAVGRARVGVGRTNPQRAARVVGALEVEHERADRGAGEGHRGVDGLLAGGLHAHAPGGGSARLDGAAGEVEGDVEAEPRWGDAAAQGGREGARCEGLAGRVVDAVEAQREGLVGEKIGAGDARVEGGCAAGGDADHQPVGPRGERERQHVVVGAHPAEARATKEQAPVEPHRDGVGGAQKEPAGSGGAGVEGEGREGGARAPGGPRDAQGQGGATRGDGAKGGRTAHQGVEGAEAEARGEGGEACVEGRHGAGAEGGEGGVGAYKPDAHLAFGTGHDAAGGARRGGRGEAEGQHGGEGATTRPQDAGAVVEGDGERVHGAWRSPLALRAPGGVA